MLRYALLGLLAGAPSHGYELKAAFERLLGGTWSLNIGQVYSTMARLERDGLVAASVVPQDGLPDRKVYTLTEDGHRELKEWLATPVSEPIRLRDELLVKVLVGGVSDGADRLALIWAQRERHLQALAHLTRLAADPSVDESTALLIEKATLEVEADLTWLDRCEERIRR